MEAATPPGQERAAISLFSGQEWLTEVARQFHKVTKKTISDVDWSAIVVMINKTDVPLSSEAEASGGDAEMPARSATPPPADGRA